MFFSLKFLKNIKSSEDFILEEIHVEVENSPLTRLFIERHKKTLLSKYEQPDEKYNISKFLLKSN